MKIICILSSCDEWKSWNSMSLVAASTSIRKIKSIIIHKIKEGDMEYRKGDDNRSKTAQIKLFRDDWKKYGMDYALNLLEYGYVKVVEDGEIQ